MMADQQYDLSVDELENLLAQLEGNTEQPPPQPQPQPEQQPQPEPETPPEQPQPQPEPQPPVNVNVDDVKLMEALADMPDDELMRWAVANGPEGLAVAFKVSRMKAQKDVMNTLSRQKQSELSTIAKKWFSGLGLQANDPKFLHMQRYVDGAIIQKGGLQNLSPQEFQDILEEAKGIFMNQNTEQPRNTVPSPTDVSGSAPASKMDISKLTPADLEKLLEKYDPEELL